MFRRLIVAGVTSLGLIGGSLGAASRGAASGAVAADAAVVPAADPGLAALRASLSGLNTMSHNVQMSTLQSVVRASMDPANGSGTLFDQEGPSQFVETVVDRQIWLKINIDSQTNSQLGITPTMWLALDMSRVPPHNALPIPADASDPIDMPGILNGVTSVDHPAPTVFTGTLDLTKITGRNQPDKGEVQRAGPGARSAPFTASTDANNRLVEFHVDSSGFDVGLSLDVTYSAYGAASRVQAPTSSVPAPDALYSILGG